MIVRHLIVNRRWILGGLAIPPILGSAPLLGGSQSSTEHAVCDGLQALHADLQPYLRAMTPDRPSALELVKFARMDGGRHLYAVVRLTWSPGVRQLGFDVKERSVERALKTLLSDIETYFKDTVIS